MSVGVVLFVGFFFFFLNLFYLVDFAVDYNFFVTVIELLLLL